MLSLSHSVDLKGHTGVVECMACVPGGLLATGSDETDKTVRVWNVAARACVAVLEGHTEPVKGLAAFPASALPSLRRTGTNYFHTLPKRPFPA